MPSQPRGVDVGGAVGVPAVSGRPAGAARRALRGWLVTGVIVVGFGLAAVALASYYGATLGVVTSLLAVLLAAVPLGVVVPTFLWLDRFEAEPTRYLVVAFLWGALVAALAAGVFNTGANLAFRAATGVATARVATAVIAAPLVEEACKGLLVVLVWVLRRREFDGIVDGMVYAGIVAAGFAFTENIQYLGLAFLDGGDRALTGTFIARCLMTPFAHPMFTMLTGIGVGIASTARSRVVAVLAPGVGYLLAASAHAMWNLGSLTAGRGAVGLFATVEVPVFLAFMALVVWARRREGRLIGRYLAPYAGSGLLTRGEVRMLSTMAGRRSAAVWARSTGGRPRLRAMRAYQDAASELALLRVRMDHDAADSDAVRREQELRAVLLARRQELAEAGVRS